MSVKIDPRSVTANAEGWNASQAYELDYWKNHWPYRDLPMPELLALRHRDAQWLLRNLGFKQAGEQGFEGLSGTLLEVGCGPIGFFEQVQGVRCTAIDSLMGAYAREIRYSTLGARGSSTYLDVGLAAITETFDYVVCSNVLDHTADWLEFLELLASRVGPGGELLLVTDTRGKPSVGHTQVFTPAQVRRAAQWLGLTRVLHDVAVVKTNNHCDNQLFFRAGRA